MATYPDPWTDDGKVWAYYNVTDTSNPTTLIYGNNGLSTITAMEVDGTAVTLATSYTFSTTGEHLVKFTLADSTVFGDTAAGIFRACNNLRRLYMPDTVTTVNRLAFYQNRGVTFIILSPNITTLGEQAFYQTSSLSIEVYLPNLESIGRACFQDSGVIKISNLGKITSLPNSTIRSTPITDLVLPATLTELVDASIYGNSSLKRVICYASTPPTRNSNVFNGSTLDWIKVMPSSVNTYKASSYWSSFSSKIYPLWEESPLSINHLSLGDFRRRIMMGISKPGVPWVVERGTDDFQLGKFYSSSSGAVTTNSVYCISRKLAVYGGHTITVERGTSNAYIYDIQRDANDTVVASHNGSPNTTTYTLNAGAKTIEVTFKYDRNVANLANLYIFDETAQKYIWAGDNIIVPT